MRLSHIKKIITLEHMEDLWLHLCSDIHTHHLTVFYCGIGVVVEWIVSENSTNTITEAEEQIALVTKMLVSTAGPGAYQELCTPQHITWTPLSSWKWFSCSPPPSLPITPEFSSSIFSIIKWERFSEKFGEVFDYINFFVFNYQVNIFMLGLPVRSRAVHAEGCLNNVSSGPIQQSLSCQSFVNV